MRGGKVILDETVRGMQTVLAGADASRPSASLAEDGPSRNRARIKRGRLVANGNDCMVKRSDASDAASCAARSPVWQAPMDAEALQQRSSHFVLYASPIRSQSTAALYGRTQGQRSELPRPDKESKHPNTVKSLARNRT